VSAGQLIDSVRDFFPRAYLTLANWTIIDYDEPDYILSSIDDDVTHNTEKRKIKRIAGFPFFLILSGFYAILYLLGENLGQISIEATGRSFLVALVASLIISGGCIWLIRPRDKAYLAGGLRNLGFFSYGHLFNLIDARTIDGFLIGRHSFFFSVFLVIVFGAFLFTLRSKNSHLASVIFLNVLLITLSIFQITRIAVYQASTRLNARNSDSTSHQDPYPSAQTATRDIYYIILDGVVREDVMEGELGYTDYSLPEELKKRGFVIPECAFSNYGTTSLSMTSSLNMNYLNKLGIPDEWVNTNKDDPPELNNLLHQNQVMRYLKQRGYSFVSFRGFFPINDFKEADYYFNFFENQQGQDVLAERSFYDMFVRTTLLRLPSELIEGNPQIGKLVPRAVAEFLAPEAGMFSSRSYQWYKQHIYNFDMLETVPSMPGSKFVYAHFYSTHQPYVFQPDGSLLWPINEDNDGYIASVQFTSRRIIEVIDQILSKSSQPPVIILQADHGIGTGLSKYKILNAYYLPEGGDNEIYPTITPVNTFRVVLNIYAEGSFDLLPDLLIQKEPGKDPFVETPASCELK